MVLHGHLILYYRNDFFKKSRVSWKETALDTFSGDDSCGIGSDATAHFAPEFLDLLSHLLLVSTQVFPAHGEGQPLQRLYDPLGSLSVDQHSSYG